MMKKLLALLLTAVLCVPMFMTTSVEVRAEEANLDNSEICTHPECTKYDASAYTLCSACNADYEHTYDSNNDGISHVYKAICGGCRNTYVENKSLCYFTESNTCSMCGQEKTYTECTHENCNGELAETGYPICSECEQNQYSGGLKYVKLNDEIHYRTSTCGKCGEETGAKAEESHFLYDVEGRCACGHLINAASSPTKCEHANCNNLLNDGITSGICSKCTGTITYPISSDDDTHTKGWKCESCDSVVDKETFTEAHNFTTLENGYTYCLGCGYSKSNENINVNVPEIERGYFGFAWMDGRPTNNMIVDVNTSSREFIYDLGLMWHYEYMAKEGEDASLSDPTIVFHKNREDFEYSYSNGVLKFYNLPNDIKAGDRFEVSVEATNIDLTITANDVTNIYQINPNQRNSFAIEFVELYGGVLGSEPDSDSNLELQNNPQSGPDMEDEPYEIRIPALTDEEIHAKKAAETEAKQKKTVTTASGEAVKTEIPGVYEFTSLSGAAVSTSRADVKKAIGLSEEEIAAGTNASIFMTDFVSKEDKETLTNVAVNSGKTVFSMVVSDMYSITKDGTITKLHNSKEPVSIMFGIPAYAADANKAFSVLCVAVDGTVVELKDTDSDPNTITIDTTVFGTYVIVY